MDNNTQNQNIETKPNGTESGTQNQNQGNGGDELITISQVELDKKIQSAEDKLRTKYSQQIKELENQNGELNNKIKELTPVQKTEAELDFEKRLASLEAREKAINLNESLTKNGLSGDFSKFVKSDADIDEFAKVFNEIVNEKVKSSAYVPENHSSGKEITKEEFAKMSYDEKAEIFNNDRELYRELSGR